MLGVAALVLIGSYEDQEFVRVGYYSNTKWDVTKDRLENRTRAHRSTRIHSAHPDLMYVDIEDREKEDRALRVVAGEATFPV